MNDAERYRSCRWIIYGFLASIAAFLLWADIAAILFSYARMLQGIRP